MKTPQVNLWDPLAHQPKEVNEIHVDHPPLEEITDAKYVGVEAFPRERFACPQSEQHKFGWMSTPHEFRSEFAKDLLSDKKATTTFSTGLVNMRDKYYRNKEWRGNHNPMAHHVGYITGRIVL